LEFIDCFVLGYKYMSIKFIFSSFVQLCNVWLRRHPYYRRLECRPSKQKERKKCLCLQRKVSLSRPSFPPKSYFHKHEFHRSSLKNMCFTKVYPPSLEKNVIFLNEVCLLSSLFSKTKTFCIINM
jgi:hypothetical protein